MRLDRASYTDPSRFALEVQHLWPQSWLLACRSVDLLDQDQRSFDVVGRSVLLTRSDSRIYAFENSCPHRGTRLCDSNRGPEIVCPYHRWRFDLDGQLRSVPDREDFDDLDDANLVGLPVEEWAGFVWVRLTAGPSLRTYLGPIASLVEAYGLEHWVTTQRLRTELGCNWKLSVDAQNEAYHVHSLHPEILGVVDDTAAQVDRLGLHSRLVVPMGRPSGRLTGGKPKLLRGLLEREGLEPDGVEVQHARSALQRARRDRARPEHAALTDEQLTDNHQFTLFPNVQLNCYADQVLLFRHLPHPSDPTRCRFEQWVLKRRGKPAEPREVPANDPAFGAVTLADLEILPQIQVGLRSGSRPLRLGAKEAAIAHHQQILAQFLAEEHEQIRVAMGGVDVDLEG